MRIVKLERRFIPWTDRSEGDPEKLSHLFASRQSLAWRDLLTKRRVVLLAEAGSGKSAEVAEQARLSREAGQYTFTATVQNLGRKGFDLAIGKAAVDLFDEWKRSNQPAWFFLDSVDEAKADRIKLEDALATVGEAIQGSELRAHVVLTGRHTNWEFRRDLEVLQATIPIPPTDKSITPVDPDDLLIKVIQKDRPPEPSPPAESPLVVVMAALTPEQVEIFARAKGVKDTAVFSAALGKSDLWFLARRPLDLDWLVGYWRKNGKFGPLAEMLQLSVQERLQEDPRKARHDPLAVDRGMNALERIGASLLLGRLTDIVIPDSSISLVSEAPGLDLAEVLPDWSGEDRAHLLSRAVFDPASAGRARLHNDNEGNVRSFLAAQWLRRLVVGGCPQSAVTRLLFSKKYGVALVKPTMRVTAAWLSLWDDSVARGVVEREPLLLMDAGDPGSLSRAVREKVLRCVAERVATDSDFEIPAHDSLKRFSAGDIAPCVLELWGRYRESAAVRKLLLLIIWLGQLRECAGIALSASYGVYADRSTRVFSGRALMATATDEEKRRYAEYVCRSCASLPGVVVWDAVEALFPRLLTVDDLLSILAVPSSTKRDDGVGFDYLGPIMVERLESMSDVERLLQGLLDRLETKLSLGGEQDSPNDVALLPSIESGGQRLLELSDRTVAPTSAIDAALRLGEHRDFRSVRGVEREKEGLASLIAATPERRRAALWRMHAVLRNTAPFKSKPPTELFELEIYGFPLRIEQSDLDWLIADTDERPDKNERVVAANSSMRLWRQGVMGAEALERLKAIGSRHPEVAAVANEWMAPREAPDGVTAQRERIRRTSEANAIAAAQRDKSWLEFAARLRADPNQLRRLPPPTAEGIDARLYNLWRLISALGSNQNRYAVSDLSALVPILGQDVVNALEDAFVAFWRRWTPTLRSERTSDKRNTISTQDCTGIVGVTLEATRNPDWAKALPDDDAEKATIYATLELNGFPQWMEALVAAKPDVARRVLLRAVAPDLQSDDPQQAVRLVDDISRGSQNLVSLLASDMFDLIRGGREIPPNSIGQVIRIVVRGYPDRALIGELFKQRISEARTPAQKALWLSALFGVDVTSAISVLGGIVDAMTPSEQTRFSQMLLPRTFGGSRYREHASPLNIPFGTLEVLVSVAYRTIRVEDDNAHPSGEVYSPDERDDAEDVRAMLFRTLVETPGHATFQAIHRLIDAAEIPIPKIRLRRLAEKRASEDSEDSQWLPPDVCMFEATYVTAPRSAKDLQRVVCDRLEDIEHDLIHGDFSQGRTVARLPDEVDVQNWFASALRAQQRHSYSVEREVHVVGEKEPDVRFRAKASDANVPMEIKVAESWSLDELETALKTQLVGQYLRDRQNRYGVLLLVHQRARSRGWKMNDGAYASYAQLVDWLRSLAMEIATETPISAQVEIVSIDLSSIERDRKPPLKRKNRSSLTPPPPRPARRRSRGSPGSRS